LATLWAPVVAVVVQVAHVVAIQPWMLDDAFIFFRYAENLAAGHGPVYNPGERVEGYTSFLWVVLLAVGHACGGDTLIVALVLGGACAIACIALVWQAPRWLPDVDWETAAWAAVLVGTFGGFTPWATSGMEVSLFAAAITGFAFMACNERVAAILLGATGALLVMTRPEGLLVAAFFFVRRVWRRRNLRDASLLALGFLLLFAPWFIWRWLYYGYPLPNTFYAKVGSTWAQVARGAQYAGRFLFAAAPLTGFVVVALVMKRWRTAAGRLSFLPWLFAFYGAAVILLGGDVMPAFRFFAPMVPLLALAATLAARALFVPRNATLVLALSAAWGVGTMRWSPDIHDHIRDDLVAEIGQIAGLWLRDHARPDAVLATNTAGTVAYYSGLRTIDMFGLNDTHIAHRHMPEMGRGPAGHEKFDGRYVASRHPDWVQFGTSIGSEAPAFPGDLELYRTMEFQENYVPRTVRLDSRRGRFTLYLYERQPNAAR
jgi:hypothetical protein